MTSSRLGPAARREPRPRFAEVGLVLAVAIVGVVIGRVTAAPTERCDDAPGRQSAPVPTQRGAAAAALDYVDALRWDVLIDDARRRAAIDARALPEAARELDGELAANAEPLRGAVTVPPVVARPVVLGYRVERFSTRRATVSIWGVVLFATGAYDPVTQWATSRIDLVWLSPRWLVASVRSRGGPSPDSSVAALAAADQRFEEVDRAP